MEEEEMRKYCEELKFQHIAEDILGLSRLTKRNKRLSKPRKHYVILKIDEFVGFVVETCWPALG